MSLYYPVFLLLIAQLNLESKWALIKDKNGIKVYTADSGKSNVKKVKVISVFKGSIREFLQIIRDVDNQTNWVYGAKRAYILKKKSANDIFYYVETDLPWPVSNRDVAIHMEIEENLAERALKITSVDSPNALGENRGIVRVQDFEAIWNVKAVDAGNIKIDYELYLNPGGNLPGAIVNRFITKGPYETFSNLAALLRDKYKQEKEN